jgi:outer membrane protein assembly factor BamD
VVMVSSYDRMGLTQLRDDTRRTLNANFPDSKLAVRDNRRSWWMFW